MHDLENNVTVINLLNSHNANGVTNELPTVPASGAFTGVGVNTYGEARKVEVLFNLIHIHGTNTVSLIIQESADDSTYSTLSAFAAKTGTCAVKVDLTPSKKYVRAYASLGATGTAFVLFTVNALFYGERYRPSNVA